jgi:hypothetical protein
VKQVPSLQVTYIQELRGGRDRHEESVQSYTYSNTLFSDEVLLHLIEMVNHHYCRYWMSENVYCSGWPKRNSLLWHPWNNTWTILSWCYCKWGNMLQCWMRSWSLASMMSLVTSWPFWFQQDGAHLHFVLTTTQWLNAIPKKWIGCHIPVEEPPRSWHLSSLRLVLWCHLKSVVRAHSLRTTEPWKECVQEEAKKGKAIPVTGYRGP